MTSIILSGACGRMGREIAAIAEGKGIRIVAGVDVCPRDDLGFPVYPSFSLCREHADVLIEFSRAEALPAALAFATERGMPVVLCATGYHEQDERMIADAAKTIAVFRSANLSLGVYALTRLCKQASALLSEFDVEIVEKHHNQKLDAPSGTAMALLAAVSDEQSTPVFGRHARSQRRESGEIGVHAVRGGTVTGVHEVGFYGADETLTLTHTAQSRAIFAHGALRAAAFMQDKPAGLYGMDELYGAAIERRD